MTVSIIIPIYNVEAYVQACLQSVANQTMTDGVECILVDDCGTDESMQLAEQFVKNYQGDITFSILHHDHNRGLSAARNTGIRAAQGEYVYLLDSDDQITSDCMEAFIEMAQRYKKVDFIQGSYAAVRDLSKFWSIPFPEYTEDRKLIKSSMLDYDIIPVNAQNRLVRREFILKHNLFFKEGIIHEDNHWTFFMAKFVERMAYCRRPTYIYTVNPNSITSSPNMENECKAFAYLIETFSQNIDRFEVGAQKRILLLTLLNMRKAHLYTTKEDLTYAMDLVKKKNNIFEKPFVFICTHTYPNSTIYNFFVRIISCIYKYCN